MSQCPRLTALVLAGTLVAANGVSAGEIRVMTSGAFAAAHLGLSPGFEEATRETIVTVTTSTGVGADSIPSRIQRREPVDVVILPDAALDQLIKDGLVMAGSKVALARSAIGMAVRAGAPKPDISSVDALKRALLQAKSVAYSASVSGEYLSTELFPRLGIADEMKPRSRRIERERVGAVVARGEAEIGFQQISELLPIPGIDYVGPLPPEIQRVTVISAGVAVAAKNPEGARRLIQFFASPEAANGITKVGLERPEVGASKRPVAKSAVTNDDLEQEAAMKTGSVLVIATSLVVASAALAQNSGAAQTKTASKAGSGQPIVMPAGELKWIDLDPKGAPGVKVANLWGDHTKGAFGAFFKLPAGFAAPLHTHTHDMHVVFVSGTYIQGPEGKPEFRLGPGSYLMQPGGNYRHTTSCDPASECIFFVESQGPFDLKLVEAK